MMDLIIDNDDYIERELLQDIKRNIYKNRNEQKDSLGLMLQFFAGEEKFELENHKEAQLIYKKFGWNKHEYFDVINSFYTTLVAALVVYSNANEPSCDYFQKFNKSWDCPVFGYGFSTELSYATKYGLCDIGKKAFSKKATDEEYLLYEIMIDFRESKFGARLEELASLCHSVANFMPCPPAYERGQLSYNQLKGTLNETADYLPLFIDKIQYCYENHLPLIYPLEIGQGRIEFETIIQWHDWLIENRTAYCLDDYYIVNGNRIIGKPLFTGQSLSYAIPKTEQELFECIDNITNRIKNRANLMVRRQKNRVN